MSQSTVPTTPTSNHHNHINLFSEECFECAIPLLVRYTNDKSHFSIIVEGEPNIKYRPQKGHTFITVFPSTTFADFKKTILAALQATGDRNNPTPIGENATINEIQVRWGANSGRFPASSYIYEHNWGRIRCYLKATSGNALVEVDIHDDDFYVGTSTSTLIHRPK